MDGRGLTTTFAATGLIVFSATSVHAACPERIDLLKEFVDANVIEEASKAEVEQLALEAVESEEACERIVAELERRLNVEVREDEVVRIGGETQADLASTATDEGGIGVEGPPAKEAEQTLAAADQQATEVEPAADDARTIGGGLDMPRDQIDTKYGPLAWMTFDEVVGAEVIGADGSPVGEVTALVRDLSSMDFFAVLDAGIGDGVVVPINQLEMADDRIAMRAETGGVDDMPEFDPDRYEDIRE